HERLTAICPHPKLAGPVDEMSTSGHPEASGGRAYGSDRGPGGVRDDSGRREIAPGRTVSAAAPRHVLVVGAGAAGLTAAIAAGRDGARVTVLNAHPRVGLKILMSGGTRCNVTHAVVTERDFRGGSSNVVRRILRAFTPEQTREWFEKDLGVPLKLEE